MHLVSVLEKENTKKVRRESLPELQKVRWLVAADVFDLVKPWCKAALHRLGIAPSVFEIVQMLLEDSKAQRYHHRSFVRRAISFYLRRKHKKEGHEADKESKLVTQAVTQQLIIFQGHTIQSYLT